VALTGCEIESTSATDVPAVVSDIARDENVVFFRTAGWLDVAAQEWHLPIRGWIYEPQDSSVRRSVFEAILDEKFDLTVGEANEANFSERMNLLIADNERGKTIAIELAGQVHELPKSAENGHFEAIVTVSVSNVAKYAEKGRLPYSAITRESENRLFEGEIRLVRPSGLSVVSDIDDTAKISNVTDHKQLLEYTFLRDFEAAPGMAELYKQWLSQEASFHFVSSSPWQLYAPLQEFLDAEGFPWATFSLKAVRFRDETLLNLFKKGTETKPAAIKEILSSYPDRVFILVGDSGEQDPEVYAALMREFPTQIKEIYIRNVTAASADDSRFTEVFAGIEHNRWHLFEDPGQLHALDSQ
jgi:hypothetical protein